jgi:hypothetical protein
MDIPEEGHMTSAQLFGGRKRALLAACALLTVVAALAAVGTSGRALAQGGAPGPGWVQLPAGGWVPPNHPLANAGSPPSEVSTGQGGCDLKTLRGSYIFAASGFNIVGGVAQPKAIIEAIDFNGDGTLDVPAATVSINGTISRSVAGVGVYTLDAECRGTVTFTSGPSFDIFTDHNGKQAWMIQTNPGTVFQGTVTKVSP